MKHLKTAAALTAGLIIGGAPLAGAGAQEASKVPLLEEMAAPYVRLRQDLAYVDETPIRAAETTREAHKRLASHNAEALGPSQLAYLALVAAQTPEFAASLNARTKKKKDREAFLEELRSNPSVVRNMDGSDEAVAAILSVVDRDASRIEGTGERYIAEAYKLQDTGWAAAKLPTGGMSRVVDAKSYAGSRVRAPFLPRQAPVSDNGIRTPVLSDDRAWTAAWSDKGGIPAVKLDTSRQIFITKALVLAARYSVNNLDQQALAVYAKTPGTDRCYSMAKMNFDQCIAATRTSYEEAFCIGTHGLADTSRCVGWVAEAGSPPQG